VPSRWACVPGLDVRMYLVASQDHAIPPASERLMAHRMGAHTVEINSSHVAMISHPAAATDLVLEAAGNK
jgi:hypothetical protein